MLGHRHLSGGTKAAKRSIQTFIVVPFGFRHTGGAGAFIIVRVPDFHKRFRVGIIQITDVHFHRSEPFHHLFPVFFFQDTSKTFCSRIRQLQRFRLGRHCVIDGHIIARFRKGTDTDHLQRIPRIDQRINNNKKNNGHKDHKTGHELGGMENLT